MEVWVYLYILNEIGKVYGSAGIFVLTSRITEGILKCGYICTHLTK